MVVSLVIIGISSILGAGILFQHQRLLTLVATAGTLAEAQWLLLTLSKRTLAPSASTEVFWLVGSIILLLPWLGWVKQWSWPYRRPGSGKRDLAVLVLLAAAGLGAWLVQSRNGYQESDWVTHGFYNGDTMTMAALVQRSMLVDGMVQENPFAANGYLEYPTLWHAGLATFLTAFGFDMDWLYFLSVLTYGQILITVPIFFLLMDTWWPEPEGREVKWLGISSRGVVLAVQSGIIGYIMALSWESYIYPQTHFFITGLWLLMVCLLVQAGHRSGWHKGWWLVVSGVLTLELLLSNAVTGAAAVAVTVVYYAHELLAPKQSWQHRLIGLGGIWGWLLAYAVLAAGDVLIGWPRFSYTAAESMVRLAPVVIAMSVVILHRREERGWIDLAIMVLAGMSIFIFFTSQRNIIVANAERFIYHGLLISGSILLAPVINLYYWWRRLWYEASNWSSWLAREGASAAIIFIFLLPVLISGARTHDQLMRQDEQRIDLRYQLALEFIRQHTEVNDVILAEPTTPWAVPMFTGRALLRADYWLAPDDEVLRDVTLAFKGNRSAQEKSLQRAQYLLIKQDEVVKWDLDKYEEVWRDGKMAIYKTSSNRN